MYNGVEKHIKICEFRVDLAAELLKWTPSVDGQITSVLIVGHSSFSPVMVSDPSPPAGYVFSSLNILNISSIKV